MSGRVLITGCSDFFGRACARALRQHGYVVDATRRTGTAAERALDVLEQAAVERAVAPCQAVVHMAAWRTYVEAEYEAARQLHIQGTMVVAQAAARFGVAMVLIGTAEEYGPSVPIPYHEDARCAPVSVYGQSKLVATREALAAWPETVSVLRPAVIYGANQPGFMLVASCVSAALTGGEVRLRGGQQTRDHVYVEDAAQAVVQAVRRHRDVRGQIVNVGSGQEQSIVSIAEKVIAIAGRGRVVLDPPSDRPGDVHRMSMSTERAERLLGWRAQTSLDLGLTKTLHALQSPGQTELT